MLCYCKFLRVPKLYVTLRPPAPLTRIQVLVVKKAAQKPKDWLLSLLETPEEPEIQGVVVVVVVAGVVVVVVGFRFPNREMRRKLNKTEKLCLQKSKR